MCCRIMPSFGDTRHEWQAPQLCIKGVPSSTALLVRARRSDFIFRGEAFEQ